MVRIVSRARAQTGGCTARDPRRTTRQYCQRVSDACKSRVGGLNSQSSSHSATVLPDETKPLSLKTMRRYLSESVGITELGRQTGVCLLEDRRKGHGTVIASDFT